jgi:4-amino-4-deoxy-L-arabinose transferase-like glycosyltransferase
VKVEAGTAERPIRVRTYIVFGLLFAAVLVVTHLSFVSLPYFWDEAGQFIPAALDLLHDGAWIPHSTLPNIHAPAIPAYLAAVWRIVGFHPEATRLAMLILASIGVLVSFLLSIELSRNARGAPAFLAAGMLMVSPIFFAQSMLAQLDAPAMLFTILALLLFLQNRIPLAAAACVALVLVKETGAITPLVFAVWLARERRWRDAAWFGLPFLALAGWIFVLKRQTGHWAGNDAFAEYNLWYPLHPARLLATLFRRLYFLLVANFHWIGAAAVVYIWRRSRFFRGRSWAIAGVLVAAHVVLFSALGGAALNRYLLPILPVVFAAMAAAITMLPPKSRRIATVAMVAGLGVSNFVNPPYPFPFEENLAFVDFLKLHRDAADYLTHWFADPVVQTAWPMTAELQRPELGFTPRKLRVHTLPDLTPSTLGAIDWSRAQIVVVFSRDWDPRTNVMRWGPLAKLWQNVYRFSPGATQEESRERIPFPIDATFNRGGQWVDIYVNPDLPRIPHEATKVALTL